MDLTSLNDLIKDVELDDITAESATGFEELPDGYYLSEVETIELRETKETHNPMIAMSLKVVEDGINISEDGNFINNNKTKGRKIFLNFVIKDEKSFKRFVSDMLKFEDENQESLLAKEYFTQDTQTMMDALEVLKGFNIYVNLATTESSDGTTKNQWKNLISWKRVAQLGLPQ